MEIVAIELSEDMVPAEEALVTVSARGCTIAEGLYLLPGDVWFRKCPADEEEGLGGLGVRFGSKSP